MLQRTLSLPFVAVPALVVASSLLGSCRHSVLFLGDAPYERTVVLEPRESDLPRLELASAAGDVRIVHTSGGPRITVEVHERAPNVSEVWFEDGVLGLDVLDEDDAWIGEVTMELNSISGDVAIGVGAGNLVLDSVPIAGDIALATGAGDIRLESAGTSGRVDVETGAGNATLIALDAAEIRVSVGAGDIELDDVWCALVSLSSGVGSIRVFGSNIGELEADTGVGDITLEGTETERHSLDAGLGSVSE